MFKFDSKLFYKRHKNEVDKYIFPELNNLHILSKNSRIQNFDDNCQYLYIEKIESLYKEIEKLTTSFDLIIITDLLEEIDDMNQFFQLIKSKLCDNGKILLTSVNNIWYPLLEILELLKFKNKSQKRAYTSIKKIKNILSKKDFILINYNTRQFFPFKLFRLGNFFNSVLELLLFKFNLGIKTYVLFQKQNKNLFEFSKSIIVPAKNEEKNLEPLITRIPKFDNLEIIIACGKSEDNTLEESKRLMKIYPELNIEVIEQKGNGKANAVFEALNFTKNDLIAILDADISVDPENLTDIFKLIETGKADFVNGTRFIYRKEKNSMRFFNILGNKVFQFLVSIVISRDLTDSLCGTKVFHKSMKHKIYDWQNRNSISDPFGDFDLLFTASYCGLNIVEFPVYYRSRVYGKTQISRFKDGFQLLCYFLVSTKSFNTSINN